ncbi:very short patch repair endonuclease [Pseudoduganella ginsengisoli]|uniref:Very short patch repair endonuclease n=1 Tax=Pseudoduganella ginsengisoli TaxID=1462440 RepID=A0A6L6Q7L9_9BURK|nr:DNA mismatch endonuclease Vsr [Pseudoduganella ginsengisoli]
MDNIDAERRSKNMRAIKSQDTLPEVIVRRLVRQLGMRYRLKYLLPGKPDLTFVGRRKVIFVHGCFWHQHGCRLVRPPKSNQSYWLPKLERTKIRDVENIAKLNAAGWSVLVVWECELKDEATLRRRLQEFLEPSSEQAGILGTFAENPFHLGMELSRYE